MTTPAPPATGSKGQAAPAPARPFRAGTFRTLVQDGFQQAVTMTAATQTLQQYSPTPNAYIRGLWIQSVMVTAGNSATVAFQADAPWIVYQQIVFADANQKPIIGPLNGYQLLVVNKYGGYQYQDDPRASVVFSATTGAGGTGGSFTFVLYVPLEVTARDTLGALQNKSASSAFQLLLTVNTIANTYSTAPTVAGTLTTTVLEDGWVQPKSTDATGNPLAQAPPQLGTTQYWTVGTYNALNGSQQVQLTQGLGYPVRNLIAVNYDVSNSTRATGDTDFPTTAQFIFRGTTFWNVTKTIWKDQMGRLLGFNGSTADVANGLENGVYALCFDQDFGLQDGADLRTGYLPTQQGDQFQLVASFNGNSNLQWIANYVAPIAGPSNLASIQAGR
jgi:hypothetical protein